MARPKNPRVDPEVGLLQALADPTRLAIVRELAASVTCACDLTSCCGVRQPTVSHHLRVLREAGIVVAERRGTSIYYSLATGVGDRLRALAAELSGSAQLIPLTTLRSPSGSSRPAEPPTC